MLSFFRINDPYRLVVIFIFIIVSHIPFWVAGNTFSLSELKWMLIGEKIANGAVYYKDVYDHMAPLAAFTYGLIDLIFGRSLVAQHIITILITFLQCAIFGDMCLRFKALRESSYVPALIYFTLGIMFFDFMTLNPVLLSVTFILLAIQKLFDHIGSHRRNDDTILNLGFYLGIAALFYQPAFLFLIGFLLSLVFYTNTLARRYLLILVGFFIPFLLVILYFAWFDALGEFWNGFFLSWFRSLIFEPLGFQQMLVVLGPLVFFLLISLLAVMGSARYINYQRRLQNAMLVFIVVQAIPLIFVRPSTPYAFMLFLPGVAFFVAHYLLQIRKHFIAEIAFATLLGMAILANYGNFFQFFFTYEYLDIDRYLVEEKYEKDIIKDKKVLVLGDNLNYYQNASLATPYLVWDIAQSSFNHLDEFATLAQVYENFQSDTPEVIIDEAGRAKELLEKIPALKAKYYSVDGVYYFLKADQ